MDGLLFFYLAWFFSKMLAVPLLLATLLSACQQNDKEEAKSEESKVMDTIMETVDGKDFLSGVTIHAHQLKIFVAFITTKFIFIVFGNN
ncbi:hypothetical protein RGU76_29045 [Bacillus pseudomycoides]|uniref:hypothetical protein n=1 Tax=Bacillus sp. DHT2 TaxID=2994532 RepID=UPI0022491FE9|nr:MULTISPECIES: hypothetical protein [Bacillus]MCX2829684.1 hypothetical protein [Bacillus sp. DHT2]MDR4918861.1 hypothetical protein [Bacillus pseudomycoides]